MLQSVVDELGMQKQISIDSAGTAGYHVGGMADERMRDHASKRGYDLTSRARKFSADDFEKFDLIVPMDRENLRDIMSLADEASKPNAEIKLLSEFLDGEWPTDVPDPYYGGAEGFEYVLDMIEAACPAIVDFCKSN